MKEDAMYVHRVEVTAKLETLDDGIAAFNSQVAPQLKQHPYYKGHELHVNRHNGKVAFIGKFSGCASPKSYSDGLMGTMAPYLTAEAPVVVELYEVAAGDYV